LKHRKGAKLRHLVLVGIAPMVSLLIFAPFSPILAAPLLSWSMLCLGYGTLLGLRLRDPCAAAAGIAAIVAQAGWSFGFFAGLFRAFMGAPGRGLGTKQSPLLSSSRPRPVVPPLLSKASSCSSDVLYVVSRNETAAAQRCAESVL
jgi:hypothetical protein